MPWVKLDDQFHANPKVVSVKNEGAGLYARALSYCGSYSTDGFVGHDWAREKGTPKLLQNLCKAGLWTKVFGGEKYHYKLPEVEGVYTVVIPGPGYFIPDFLIGNPTRKEVENKRNGLSEKRAAAGRAGARARWQSDSNVDGKTPENDGKTDSKAIANAWQVDGPVPVPVPLKNNPSAVQASPREQEQHRDINIPNLREIA